MSVNVHVFFDLPIMEFLVVQIYSLCAMDSVLFSSVGPGRQSVQGSWSVVCPGVQRAVCKKKLNGKILKCLSFFCSPPAMRLIQLGQANIDGCFFFAILQIRFTYFKPLSTITTAFRFSFVIFVTRKITNWLLRTGPNQLTLWLRAKTLTTY